MKQLVFLLVLFGLYTGYKFAPSYFTTGQVEGAIENVLRNSSHTTTDDTFRTKVVRIASENSIPLEERDIQIRRGSSHGERVVEIDFEYPYTVSYLGSERSFVKDVSLAHAFQVDEAAEARSAQQFEENMRRVAEQERRRRKLEGENLRKIDAEWKKCEKAIAAGMDCSVWSFGPGGARKVKDRVSAEHWNYGMYDE
jgi:hypothetical protein